VIPAGGTVRIAFQGPVSGPAANLLPAMVNAVRMAINDYGSILDEYPIDLIFFDDQCNQEAAASGVGQFLEDYPDLAGVIGPLCSSGGLGAYRALWKRDVQSDNF